MGWKVIHGPFGTLDEPLLDWVNSAFTTKNLVELILHAHLLLERALEAKIAEKLARPSVLNSTHLARLSFAQKITMFIGLHDPESDTETLLIAFNRLRNALAHDLVDAESAVKRHLRPPLEAAMKHEESQLSAPEEATAVVKVVFGKLMLLDLGALHGVQRVADVTDEGST